MRKRCCASTHPRGLIYLLSSATALSHRATFNRTSSAMARMPRVRLARPDAARPCKPPATRFSCTTL